MSAKVKHTGSLVPTDARAWLTPASALELSVQTQPPLLSQILAGQGVGQG